MSNPHLKNGRKTVFLIIAALMMAGIAIAAILLRNSDAPENAAAQDYGKLTLLEEVSFNYLGIADMVLRDVIVDGDVTTLVLRGVFNDDRNPDTTYSYAESDLGGCLIDTGTLQFGEGYCAEYTCRQNTLGLTLYFEIPEGTLTSGEDISYDLVLPDEKKVSFSLRGAKGLEDLSSASACGGSEEFRVAAAAVERPDGVLTVDLYCDNQTDMSLHCYGVGGNQSLGWYWGMMGENFLCLNTENGAAYPLEPSSASYYLSTFTFDIGGSDSWTLELPYVILSSGESLDISREFSSVAQLEIYTETIALLHGELLLETQINETGEVVLYASVRRNSDSYRIAGIDMSTDNVLTFGDIAPDESNRACVLLNDNANLSESLGFTFSITDVKYALITELSLDLR